MNFRKHYLIPLLAGGLAGGIVVACGGSDSDGTGTDSNPASPGNGTDGSGSGSDGSDGSGSGSDGSDGSDGSGSGSDGSEGSEGSDGSGGLNSGEGGSSDGLTLRFSPMYSVFDGERDYKVPVLVTGADVADVEWSADDPEAVYIEQTQDGAMLTTRKGGEFVITAKSGDKTATATLTVTQVDPSLHELGGDRYNNGIPALDAPNFDGGLPGFGDGGFPGFGALGDGGIGQFFGDGGFRGFGDGGFGGFGDGGFGGFGDGGFGGFRRGDGGLFGDGGRPDFINNESACTSCHGQGSDSVDVEHTPQQTAGYSDEELIAIFTMGQKPAGSEFQSLGQIDEFGQQTRDAVLGAFEDFGITIDFEQIAERFGTNTDQTSLERLQQRWSDQHQWEMTEEEKMGIVVYLRGLEPKSQGPLDFGALSGVTDALGSLGGGN